MVGLKALEGVAENFACELSEQVKMTEIYESNR